MSPWEVALVRLSAAVATRDEQRVAEALDRAAAVAQPTEIEEAILQSYLFAGYPASLEAMRAWRIRSGVAAPQAPSSDEASWPERGERVCATVYAGQYEKLRANVAALHPDLERWMVVEGYGKVLGRPGLALRTRELCVIALLAGQPAGAQLYAHLRGALNAGAMSEDIDAALTAIAELVPVDAMQRARQIWDEVRTRRHRRARTDAEA